MHVKAQRKLDRDMKPYNKISQYDKYLCKTLTRGDLGSRFRYMSRQASGHLIEHRVKKCNWRSKHRYELAVLLYQIIGSKNKSRVWVPRVAGAASEVNQRPETEESFQQEVLVDPVAPRRRFWFQGLPPRIADDIEVESTSRFL